MDLDDTVPLAQSLAGRDLGAELVVIPGADHFDVIDPTHEAWRFVSWNRFEDGVSEKYSDRSRNSSPFDSAVADLLGCFDYTFPVLSDRMAIAPARGPGARFRSPSPDPTGSGAANEFGAERKRAVHRDDPDHHNHRQVKPYDPL